jgi:hypothetical protein
MTIYYSFTLFYREHAKVSNINAVIITPTGGRGRPRKLISSTYLHDALGPGRNISAARLSKTLGLHRNTLARYVSMYKIKRPKFSPISDADLDEIVTNFRLKRPSTGIRYLRGHLFLLKIRVQKKRIYDSITRVDGLNKTLRQHTTIKRREYHSARPNALWHIDGHHKLILWGIVIHGITDGFDRTVSTMEIRPPSYN